MQNRKSMTISITPEELEEMKRLEEITDRSRRNLLVWLVRQELARHEGASD